MGLYVTYDCWTGAYSSFKEFRTCLREAAGISEGDFLWEIERGFADGSLPEKLQGDYDTWKPSDPIMYLLAHSDCDGKIRPREAKQIADRLTALLLLIPDEGASFIETPREKAMKFAVGCYKAAKARRSIEFG